MNSISRDHPIFTRRYILMTKPVQDFVLDVARCIENREPGLVVSGRPRLGKTWAIRYFSNNLSHFLDRPFPTFKLNCDHSLSTTRNEFFEQILQGFNHAFTSQGRANDKRQRIIEHIYHEANRYQEYVAIFFIDEAQWLKESHYKWLIGIYNDLCDRDVHLLTVLVGQPELLAVREAMAKAKEFEIIGRFMTSTHVFHGLRSVQEIKQALEGYDYNSEYPEGSNISFTRAFVPLAFQNGWSLSNNADIIATTIWKQAEKSTGRRPEEIPMQNFTACVRYILRYLSELDESDLNLTEEIIQQAYGSSGHSNLINALSSANASVFESSSEWNST